MKVHLNVKKKAIDNASDQTKKKYTHMEQLSGHPSIRQTVQNLPPGEKKHFQMLPFTFNNGPILILKSFIARFSIARARQQQRNDNKSFVIRLTEEERTREQEGQIIIYVAIILPDLHKYLTNPRLICVLCEI